MGFFTFPLARMVGETGCVIAVDIQPKMLDVLARRAAKAGLLPRLRIRTAQADTLGLTGEAGRVDFVLAFYMVHELPSAWTFFQEAAATLKTGAGLLLVEPAGHVPPPTFEAELAAAAAAGLTVVERPLIRRSLAALLRKG
jgi:SAM-dependent methyltransferase